MGRFREVRYRNYYPKQRLFVYGVDHYISKDKGGSDYSMYLRSFKENGWNLTKIPPKAKEAIEEDIEPDSPIDIVTLMPTSEQGEVNEYMKKHIIERGFIKKGFEYDQVLERREDVEKQHKTESFDERFHNINGSLNCTSDVEGKTVLVVDDILTTGLSMLEAQRSLLAQGAEKVYGFVLGLNLYEDEYMEVPDEKTFWEIVEEEEPWIEAFGLKIKKKWKKKNFSLW